MLRGVIDHILPRVGEHVQTLDLSHGKAVSNEIVSLLGIIRVAMPMIMDSEHHVTIYLEKKPDFFCVFFFGCVTFYVE